MNSGRGCRDVKPVSNVNAYRMEKEKAGRREASKREREREGNGTGIRGGTRYTRQTGSMLPVCSRTFKQRVIDWLRVCQSNELEIFALCVLRSRFVFQGMCTCALAKEKGRIAVKRCLKEKRACIFNPSVSEK